MIKVGIYGASGYMGGEALRVLSEHPQVEIAWLTSRGDKAFEYFHKNFYGSGYNFIKPEDVSPCDVVFSALPSGQIMKEANKLIASGTKIIDLGADFRLKNREDWERIYGKTHQDWDMAKEAVYGIPELHRQEIKNANIIANPGCFSSAAILGLAPLIKNNIIDSSKIIVDGLSGTAGAGAETDRAIHHPEIGNNLVPYNVVDHRHTYEIEQELGILGQKEVMDLPKEDNASWQYIPYPWVSAVSGTNYCRIGLDVDERRGRIVAFSVLNSIGKGGAHVAVQNMNLLFGFEETTGLKRYGLHPY